MPPADRAKPGLRVGARPGRHGRGVARLGRASRQQPMSKRRASISPRQHRLIGRRAITRQSRRLSRPISRDRARSPTTLESPARDRAAVQPTLRPVPRNRAAPPTSDVPWARDRAACSTTDVGEARWRADLPTTLEGTVARSRGGAINTGREIGQFSDIRYPASKASAPPSAPGSKLPGCLRPSHGRRGASLVLVPKGRTTLAREFHSRDAPGPLPPSSAVLRSRSRPVPGGRARGTPCREGAAGRPTPERVAGRVDVVERLQRPPYSSHLASRLPASA